MVAKARTARAQPLMPVFVHNQLAAHIYSRREATQIPVLSGALALAGSPLSSLADSAT